MKGYNDNIEEKTIENSDFRRVLYTTAKSQLVLMSLKPGEDIGEEVHPDNDQFIRVEKGTGEAVIDGKTHAIEDGSAIVVPAGASHNIINTSDEDALKIYTIYSPAHHKDGTVHATKADALADDEEFDGQTTE